MSSKSVDNIQGNSRAGVWQALADLRAGKLDQAEIRVQQLLREAPSDPALHQLAATIALQGVRYADAERWAQSCLEIHPEHAPAMLIAGQAARAAGNLVRAVAWLQRAVKAAPNQPEPVFQLCVGQLESGDPAAQNTLERALGLFPDFAEGWRDIGRALYKANRMAAAVTAFRKALVARPDFIEVMLPLAQCLRLTGQTHEARATLERLAALHSGNANVYFALGLVCDDLHDASGAIAAYRKCLELQPGLPEAHVNLGLALQQAGQLEQAISSYRSAVQLREDTFGRIAQSLTSAPKGQMWLNLGKLRQSLRA